MAFALAAPTPAAAQDAATLAKVKDLNNKAIEAYENLEPEEARKFLQQALDACAAEGLDRHPLKATTHVHLGVVLVGGLKQKDAGIKQFRRALEINPSAKIAKRLSTPEVQAAFEEASKEGGAAPATPVETPKPEPPAKPAPDLSARTGDEKPPAQVKGVYHEPVTEAHLGQPINVKAAIENALQFEKLVLAYRPEGASDFLARDMEKESSGWYTARIPEPATNGNSVSYYIEARGRTGQAVAANGSSSEPHVVALSAAPAADAGVAARAQQQHGDNPEGEAEAEAGGGGGGKLLLALGLGGGYGYTSGSPEVNPKNKAGKPIEFSGFAPAQLLHLAPEIGYQVAPNMILSLQGRFQVITGATEVHHSSCDGGVCYPAKGAALALVRATWLLGEGVFRPFLSLGAGAGTIRHLINLQAQLKDCGPKMDQGCVDTVAQGSLFVGPSAGFFFNLSDSLAFLAGLNALMSLPSKIGFNFDLNIGLALRI